MNKINSDVASIYSSAAKKVETLEDDAFKRLTALAKQRADAYKADITKMDTELGQQIGQVQNRYDALFRIRIFFI